MQTHDIELGHKTSTVCPDIDQKHHSSCIMTSNPLSPPASLASFSHIGDFIGMESCADLTNYEEDELMMSIGGGESKGETNRVHQSCHRSRRDEGWAMNKKEFPPPISLLTRTENLPSHMTFALKRYYTNDGRLILVEEKVRRHEYFRAHRSNGHLILQLVPLDDDDDDSFNPPFDEENENDEQDCEEAEVEADKENEDGLTYMNNKVEGKEEILHKNIEGLKSESYETHQLPESLVENERTIGVSSNDGSGVCLNYCNVLTSSSCFLGGLPVPAIKPVHT